MRCADNSSFEFVFYSKLKQFSGVSDAAAGPCRPLTAVDHAGVNGTAVFCRDGALNDSATGGGGGLIMQPPYSPVEMYLYMVVIPLICVIGIVGNSINLVVLASIVRNKPMDRMERSATMGLLALAVSDLVFCSAVIPLAFVDDVIISDRLTLALLYRVYHPAVISSFITSSTWLTVVMAVSRYLAICHPLKARIIIGMRFAAGSIAVAFLFSILLNVPRFFHLAIACVDGDDGVRYFQVPGLLQRHGAVDQTYYALYLVVGIVLPLAVLAYSNFFLIRAVRNSRRMRRQFQRRGRDDRDADADPRAGRQQQQQQQQHQSQADTTNAITLTLTIIVIMYAVLVSPAEIGNIFTQMITTNAEVANNSAVHSGDEDGQNASVHPDSYNVAVAVANTLQTLNFACNFILYCAVNVYFRRIVHQMVTCRPWWRWTAARQANVTVAATFAGRSPARNAHLNVTPATNNSRLYLSTISPDRDHFDISDAEEFHME